LISVRVDRHPKFSKIQRRHYKVSEVSNYQPDVNCNNGLGYCKKGGAQALPGDSRSAVPDLCKETAATHTFSTKFDRGLESKKKTFFNLLCFSSVFEIYEASTVTTDTSSPFSVGANEPRVDLVVCL
jgi:hypothetical protein